MKGKTAFILCISLTFSYLCTRVGRRTHSAPALPGAHAIGRDGRVVDYSSLENCRAERHRGFESLSLRNKGCKPSICEIYTFFTAKNVKLGVFVFFKILQKNVNYKAIGISMDWQNEPL